MTPFECVKRDGQLLVIDRLVFDDYVAALAEGQVQEMTLADPDVSRTARQSKYLHAEPVKKLCTAEGYTPAQAKLVLLGEFFGWMQTPSGRFVPEKASTSELTKDEFTALIDWCPVFGAENNINILPPEQDPARRDPRVRFDEATS